MLAVVLTLFALSVIASAAYLKPVILLRNGMFQLECPNPPQMISPISKRELGGAYFFDSEITSFTIGLWIRFSQVSIDSTQSIFYFSTNTTDSNNNYPLLSLSIEKSANVSQNLSLRSLNSTVTLNSTLNTAAADGQWVFISSSIQIEDQSITISATDGLSTNNLAQNTTQIGSSISLVDYPMAGLYLGSSPNGQIACTRLNNPFFAANLYINTTDGVLAWLHVQANRVLAHFLVDSSYQLTSQTNKNLVSSSSSSTVSMISGFSKDYESTFDPIYDRRVNAPAFSAILSNRKFFSLIGAELQNSFKAVFNYYTRSNSNDVLFSSQSTTKSGDKMFEVSQFGQSDGGLSLVITIAGNSSMVFTSAIPVDTRTRIVIEIECAAPFTKTVARIRVDSSRFVSGELAGICLDFQKTNGKLFMGTATDLSLNQTSTHYKIISDLYLISSGKLLGLSSLQEIKENYRKIDSCELLLENTESSSGYTCLICSSGRVLFKNTCVRESQCFVATDPLNPFATSVEIVANNCIAKCSNRQVLKHDILCPYDLLSNPSELVGQVVASTDTPSIVVDISQLNLSAAPFVFVGISGMIHDNTTNSYDFSLATTNISATAFTVSFTDSTQKIYQNVTISYYVIPSDSAVQMSSVVSVNLSDLTVISQTDSTTYYSVNFASELSYIPDVIPSILGYSSVDSGLLSYQINPINITYTGFTLEVSTLPDVTITSVLLLISRNAIHFTNEFADLNTTNTNGWGVSPASSTHRYLNTLNTTISSGSKRVDPTIQPFSFIRGIANSNPDFIGLNLTLNNNTITHGSLLVDYVLTNITALNYFRADTFVLPYKCNISACLSFTEDSSSQIGTANDLSLSNFDESGAQISSGHVKFSKFFQNSPQVFLVLSSLNTYNSTDFNFYADNISYDGFDILSDGLDFSEISLRYFASEHTSILIDTVTISANNITADSPLITVNFASQFEIAPNVIISVTAFAGNADSESSSSFDVTVVATTPSTATFNITGNFDTLSFQYLASLVTDSITIQSMDSYSFFDSPLGRSFDVVPEIATISNTTEDTTVNNNSTNATDTSNNTTSADPTQRRRFLQDQTNTTDTTITDTSSNTTDTSSSLTNSTDTSANYNTTDTSASTNTTDTSSNTTDTSANTNTTDTSSNSTDTTPIVTPVIDIEILNEWSTRDWNRWETCGATPSTRHFYGHSSASLVLPISSYIADSSNVSISTTGWLNAIPFTNTTYIGYVNVQRGYLQSLRMSVLDVYMRCPSGCSTCNEFGTCLTCDDTNREPPHCSCKASFREDSNGNCLECIDGCCKSNASNSLCSMCSDSSLSLALNCQCKSNNQHFMVYWVKNIVVNITLTNGGDIDSFAMLGCNTCTSVKKDRTILLTQSDSSVGISAAYSSLTDSLGNLEYEVTVMTPPDYLCYGAIKKEKRFMVGLAASEASSSVFDVSILPNTMSVCSDRKTYAAEATVLQANTVILNWQKTYNARFTENVLRIKEIATGTEVYATKYSLTFERIALYGRYPYFTAKCEAFIIAAISEYLPVKKGISTYSINGSTSSTVRLFPNSNSIYNNSTKTVFQGWFYMTALNATQKYSLLQIQSKDGKVFFLIGCVDDAITFQYRNIGNTRFSRISEDPVIYGLDSLTSQWFLITLEWLNGQWETSFTLSVYLPKRRIPVNRKFDINTAPMMFSSTEFEITVNPTATQASTAFPSSSYSIFSQWNGYTKDIGVFLNQQINSSQQQQILATPSIDFSQSFSHIVFYYEFTSYDFTIANFMKDYSGKNKNFITDSFLAAVQNKVGLKVTSNKAFDIPTSFYASDITEDYGFSVGFTLQIKQASRFEGQILRIGNLSVRLAIADDHMYTTSNASSASLISKQYYLISLCILEQQCLRTSNVRIPVNSSSAFGIVIAIKKLDKGNQSLLAVNVYGESSEDIELIFSDTQSSSGFAASNISLVNTLPLRIGSSKNDFIDSTNNYFIVRRLVLQSGSYVKPASALLAKYTAQQQSQSTSERTTLSSLKATQCLLQLGKNINTAVCVKCNTNYENILGSCVSNGECDRYTQPVPFERSANDSGINSVFYFDYTAKRCAACNTNCGACKYAPDNCTVCAPGFVDAPRCRSCPYKNNVQTYFNPISATCVETCPSTFCTDAVNLICKKCDASIRRIYRDLDTVDNTYKGEYWSITNTIADTTNSAKIRTCYLQNAYLGFLGANGLFTGSTILHKTLTRIPHHYAMKYSFVLLISSSNFIVSQSLLSSLLLLKLDIDILSTFVSMQPIGVNEMLCSSGLSGSSSYNVTVVAAHIYSIADFSIAFNTSSLSAADSTALSWGIRSMNVDIFQCHFSCFTCSGPLSSDCLSCTDDLIFVTGQCLCADESKYMKKRFDCWENPCYTCETCAAPCSYCDTEGVCLTCKAGMYLYENQCFSDCADAKRIGLSKFTTLINDSSKGICVPYNIVETITEFTENLPATQYKYASKWTTPANELLSTCGVQNFIGPLDSKLLPMSRSVAFTQPIYALATSIEIVLFNSEWSTSGSNFIVTVDNSTNLFTGQLINQLSYPQCSVNASIGSITTSAVQYSSQNITYSLSTTGQVAPLTWAFRKVSLAGSVCPTYCKSCSSQSVCTSCVENSTLDPMLAICKCPEGFIYSMKVGCTTQPCGVCQACHSSCQRCFGPGPFKCLMCKKGYKRMGQRCVKMCPDNYYENIYNKTCQPCDSSCFTCIGSKPTECLSCYAPAVLSENQCLPSCSVPQQSVDKYARTCKFSLDQQLLLYFSAATGSIASFNSQLQGIYYSSDNKMAAAYACGTSNNILIGAFANTVSLTLPNVSQHSSLHVTFDVFLQATTNLTVSSSLQPFASSVASMIPFSQSSQTCSTTTTNYAIQKADFYLSSFTSVLVPSLTLTITSSSSSFSLRELAITTIICHSSCLSCSGPSASECLTCVNGAQLTNLNTCTCINPSETLMYVAGSESDPIQSFCSKCKYPCTSCFAVNNYACLSCEQGFFLKDYSCVSACPPLKYQQLEDQWLCKKCPSPCDECTPDGRYCITCQPGYFLSMQNTCVLACGKAQFANENGVCQQCDPSCSSCTGQLPTQCVTCTTGHFRNQLTNTCDKCHEYCVECTDATNLACTLCAFGIIQVNSICTVDCSEIAGTYVSNGTCSNCDPQCKRCSGPNFTDCIQCQDGLALENSVCVDCHPACASCFGTTISQCYACNQGYFLQGSSCVPQCSSGFYGKDAQCIECDEACSVCYGGTNSRCFSCNPGYFFLNNSCIPCSSKCRTCFGETSSQCLVCTQGNYLLQSTCYSDAEGCPNRYFGDKLSRTCKQCDTSCQKCEGASPYLCTACDAGSYLSKIQYNINGKLLPSGCSKCPSTCKTCVNAQTCLVCVKGFFLQNGACVSQCDNSAYEDLIEGVCKPCPTSCATCQGYNSAGKFICSTCANGFYLSDDMSCVPCQAGCILCSTANSCTKCYSGYVKYKNTCMLQCPQSYYASEQFNCVKCISPCQVCSSPSFCSLCENGYFVQTTQSTTTSQQSNPIQVVVSQTCQVCHPVCETCSGSEPTDCVVCKYPLFLQDGICVQQCKQGYYGSSGVCVACPPKCTTCISGDICTSCIDQFVNIKGTCLPCFSTCTTCFGTNDSECSSCAAPYNLLDTSCILSCPHAFYQSSAVIPASVSKNINSPVNTNICKTCHPSCSDCLDGAANSCTGCIDRFYLTPESTCLSCSNSCLTCAGNPYTCTSCPIGSYLFQGLCLDYCPEKYYGDMAQRMCVACVSPCKTCSGPGKNQCKSCVEQFYYAQNLCIPCHKDCQSCFGIDSTECYSCKPGIQQSGTSCISCGSQKYYDNNLSECMTCNSSCQDCYGSSLQTCLSCRPGRYLDNAQCNICSSTCSECTSMDFCTGCVNGYQLLKVSDYLQICVKKCPIGMEPSPLTNTCSCTSNCLSCAARTDPLAATGYSTRCSKCITGSYVLNRIDPTLEYSCLDASACSGFVNTMTQECVQSCPSNAPFVNHIARQCTSSQCPINSVVQYIKTQGNCLSECPSGYFANERKQCMKCHSLCSSCFGPLANQCSVCANSNVLFHPEISTCANSCLIGFNYESSDASCRICHSMCKQCVSSLVYLSGLCLDECPVGYAQTAARKCVQNNSQSVKILNNFDSVLVRINKDVVLEASIFAQGAIKQIEWILKKSSDSEFIKSFDLLQINQLSITLPYLALKPSQTYTFRIEVTLASLDVLNSEIGFTTAGEIAQGAFLVSPTSGEAGSTMFSLGIDKWKYPLQLKVDISFYVLELQYQMVESEDGTLSKQSSPDFVKRNLVQIFAQEMYSQTSALQKTYVFPMNFAADSTTYAVEMKIYSEEGSVESFAYSMITLTKSRQIYTDLLGFSSDTAAKSSLYLLTYVLNLRAVYAIDSSKVSAYLQNASINTQIALSQKKKYSPFSQCDPSVDCFGQGSCTLLAQVYSCTCLKGFLGVRCQWVDNDYSNLQSAIPQLISALTSDPIASTAAPVMLTQIISNVIYYTDFISDVKALSALAVMSIRSAISSSTLDQVHLQLYQSASAYISTQLQSDFSDLAASDISSLQSLSEQIKDLLSKNINLGEALTQQSPTSDSVSKPISVQQIDTSSSSDPSAAGRRQRRRLQQLSRILATSSSKKSIPLVFNAITVDIPPEVITTTKKVVVSGTSFKKDPRSNPNAITSTLSLSLGGDAGRQSVSDAPKPFILNIPKKVPSPAGSNPDAIQCTYYDEETNSYKSDGCSFVKETITNIVCSCTHLTDFSAAMLPAMIKNVVSLADMKEAQAKGNSMLASKMPATVKITNLPKPKIGQRNVNLQNAVNIQMSGGVHNVLAKQVFIVVKDGEGDDYSRTYSMWEFLEEESLDGLIRKNSNDQPEDNVSTFQNLSFGSYVIIGFSIFFFLFKLGNRASIKFTYIEVDNDYRGGGAGGRQATSRNRNGQKQSIEMAQTPIGKDEEDDDDDDEGDKSGDDAHKYVKGKDMKSHIKAALNDNEYENSIVVLTAKKSKQNYLLRMPLRQLIQGNLLTNSTLLENAKTAPNAMQKPSTFERKTQHRQHEDAKKELHDKKMKELLESVRIIETEKEKVKEKQKVKKQKSNLKTSTPQTKPAANGAVIKPSHFAPQAEGHAASETTPDASPKEFKTTQASPKITFKKELVFHKVDLTLDDLSESHQESAKSNENSANSSPKPLMMTPQRQQSKPILKKQFSRQSTNTKAVDTPQNDTAILMTTEADDRSGLISGIMMSPDRSNGGDSVLLTDAIKGTESPPSKSCPPLLLLKTNTVSSFTSIQPLSRSNSMAGSPMRMMKRAVSIADSSFDQQSEQQPTFSHFSEMRSSMTSGVSGSSSYRDKMQDNVLNERHLVSSNNIHPFYSIFNARDMLLQSKATRMLYLFATMYGYLAWNFFVYRWCQDTFAAQPFVNYLFYYNPHRLGIIILLANTVSHVCFGFLNHTFSRFVSQLKHKQITVDVLNKLRAHHTLCYLTMFAALYTIYSFTIKEFGQTLFISLEEVKEIIIETFAALFIDSVIIDPILLILHKIIIDPLPDDYPLKTTFETFQTQRGFFYTLKTEHPKALELVNSY